MKKLLILFSLSLLPNSKTYAVGLSRSTLYEETRNLEGELKAFLSDLEKWPKENRNSVKYSALRFSVKNLPSTIQQPYDGNLENWLNSKVKGLPVTAATLNRCIALIQQSN